MQLPNPNSHLPDPDPAMTWRDLRSHADSSEFHTAACRYANFLWMQSTPARAILALCRAIYTVPQEDFPQPTFALKTYSAYAWFLRQSRVHPGFLGNPRISFAHQATRMKCRNAEINRFRAWALWHLTRAHFPSLPPDPKCTERAPCPSEIAGILGQTGYRGESSAFLGALH